MSQLQEQVDAAESALRAAEASATAANKRRALETLNAVAMTGFYIAGLSVSATTPVGAGILAGSILWGQGMTVVKAATLEDPVDGLEIATGVAADRLGTVLSEYSASSYAASGRIATVGGVMGKLLSSAGMLKSWADLATAEARYQDAVARGGEIYSWLQDMRLALAQLEDIALAEQIRAQCIGWLKEDTAAIACLPPQN
ncbi:hypothetical protein [Ruegeria sp. HKCCD7318]|uniref:hypothetical protein n=1 Tax=Ruegeria sp. HKCCD7318 TaxID=2683014 RepID=UPI001C126453|nr:hypothetical protein [Ruegeria sp. HKCCD7318]